MTGIEGVGAVPMQTVPDQLTYPSTLTLMAFPNGSLEEFPGPIKDSKGLASRALSPSTTPHTYAIHCHCSGWWLVDGGSVVPIFALDLKPTDAVLDMCAAPGGKSLMIIQTRQFGATLPTPSHSFKA